MESILLRCRKNKVVLNDFGRFQIYCNEKDGEQMNYQMIQAEEMHFIGYKTHFSGIPSERSQQEEDFFVHTRLQQFALNGLVKDCETLYTLVTNVDDKGYDFYICAKICTGRMLADSGEIPEPCKTKSTARRYV